MHQNECPTPQCFFCAGEKALLAFDPARTKPCRVFVLVVVIVFVCRLHAFLLEQLERAASHTTAEAGGRAGDELDNGQVAGGFGTEMHPVLYPILLLLARLRNSGGDALDAVKTEVMQLVERSEIAVHHFITARIVLLLRFLEHGNRGECEERSSCTLLYFEPQILSQKKCQPLDTVKCSKTQNIYSGQKLISFFKYYK